MALREEWRRRVDRWQELMWENFYRPVGAIPLEGFTTHDFLSAEEAQRQAFRPMQPGSPWGSKWEYGWFKGQVIVPPELAGLRLAVQLRPNGRNESWAVGESLVWVNGKVMGSVGWGHREMTLSQSAQPGEKYDILLEAYAGHGRIFVGNGPIPYGTESIPEPPPAQVVVGESTFGVWREELYQLALDFTTLHELRDALDQKSLRVAEIDEALMDVTLIFDIELPEAEMMETVRQARARLKPLMECKNGPSMPTLHAFGHAHLDIAWLWPWQESERKMARTAINQLALAEEYPGYRFLQSQTHLYWMLRNRYPELYERFKTAIKKGDVIADGAMWVEADTNVSGGEALIRQVMYGRKFFQEELGVDSRVLWLPDVFGYSGSLPQILVGCGCVGFATQKITWAYNGGDPFPHNIFWWEGIDGSAIPAHIYNDYNNQTRPKNVFERWNTRQQANGIQDMMFAFGWGDGGGGPTRDHLEFLRRAADLEGMPRLKISSPAEYFETIQKKGLPKERYVGELYFQAHRGTYTSQAKTKKGNRLSEFALREAELWGVAARALTGYTFGPKTLEDPWRRLMLNQFHDILPGSSIHRVYEEAELEYAKVIEAANQSVSDALSQFVDAAPGGAAAPGPASASGASAVTVFNSLSWQRQALIEVGGKQMEVTLPACGWTTVQPGAAVPPSEGVKVTANSLENEYLKATFNARGELASLWDKETRRELMAAPGNAFRLYKDVPTMWDAWDIDSMAEQSPVATDEPVKLEVYSSTPLVGELRLTRKLSHSAIVQVIRLRKGSRRIDFKTAVDWQESHRMLKVAFPVDIHADEAIHEVQFGYLRRPTHRSRPYDADRFEVCNQKWTALTEENRGAAVLNDSKYGLSVQGKSINLTLLKSALAPDMTADKGAQLFTYALYTWNGTLAESEVVRQAYDLNIPVRVVPGAAGEMSLFSLDAPNIIIDTVKPAEDGSRDIILRLYEAKHMATRCTLSTALVAKAAEQTNMLEETQIALPLEEGKVALDFRPFEIKTVRLCM
jgi:alpha-mannosidase